MGFFLAVIVAGYTGNSIALVSDSFNMLSDVISLSVGLMAAHLRRHDSSLCCTYGLVHVEVLGVLANAMFLSAQVLEEPEAIDQPALVLIVGSIGCPWIDCVSRLGSYLI